MTIDGLKLPVFIVCSASLLFASAGGENPARLVGALFAGIAITLLFAQIGRLFPALKALSLETISIVLVPSYAVYAGWLQFGSLDRVRYLFQASDVIGVFITILIVGSIVGADRQTLVAGLTRVVVPLSVGSIAAAIAGVLVGYVCGAAPADILLWIAAPIMGGGLTAGAIPLSEGYASIVGSAPGVLLAKMIPAVILGNLAAMICAAVFGLYDSRLRRTLSPQANRLGRIADSEAGMRMQPKDKRRVRDIAGFSASTLMLAALYMVGVVASAAFAVPSTLVVLAVAALLLISDVLPSSLREHVGAIYRLCVTLFTYPLLFAVGLLLTPWAMIAQGFAPSNFAAISAVVVTLAMAGAATSRWIGLDPVDGGIVTVTRAAMGGTGDIAILSAARRLDLMPFAQIATRIGGAITVALTLLVLDVLNR